MTIYPTKSTLSRSGTLNVRLDSDTKRAFAALALAEGVTQSQLTRRLIIEYLNFTRSTKPKTNEGLK